MILFSGYDLKPGLASLDTNRRSMAKQDFELLERALVEMGRHLRLHAGPQCWRRMGRERARRGGVEGGRHVDDRTTDAALPMTGTGKIQKTELRKLFWEGQGRALH